MWSVKSFDDHGQITPTLILKALLKPLAKKPPKGPMIEAKADRAMLWIWKGYNFTVV